MAVYSAEANDHHHLVRSSAITSVIRTIRQYNIDRRSWRFRPPKTILDNFSPILDRKSTVTNKWWNYPFISLILFLSFAILNSFFLLSFSFLSPSFLLLHFFIFTFIILILIFVFFHFLLVYSVWYMQGKVASPVIYIFKAVISVCLSVCLTYHNSGTSGPICIKFYTRHLRHRYI